MGALAQVGAGPASSTFVAIFGAVAVVLTTLIGLVTALTGLVKLIRRPHDQAVADEGAVDPDVEHERRAWAETLEQLDAAGERAVAAEAEARHWRDKYVALLEGRHTDPDPPPRRRRP